jgi:predicted component of type VI protein secretion system
LCWELYNEIFEDISKDADDGFRRLLAEDFAAAYEEQVNSMKRARFKNKP